MYIVSSTGDSVFCLWKPSNLEHSPHSSCELELRPEHTPDECVTSTYISAPLLCSLVLLSLGHILQCNDFNLLQGFEPCQSYHVILTTVHWHNVSTSQVAHQGLDVDREKLW